MPVPHCCNGSCRNVWAPTPCIYEFYFKRFPLHTISSWCIILFLYNKLCITQHFPRTKSSIMQGPDIAVSRSHYFTARKSNGFDFSFCLRHRDMVNNCWHGNIEFSYWAKALKNKQNYCKSRLNWPIVHRYANTNWHGFDINSSCQ